MGSRTASCLAGSDLFAKRRRGMPVGGRPKDETAYYLANIGHATSIAAFVGHHRLFSYAMRAYGLEDRVYAKSLMTQILQAGVTEASKPEEDPRFRAFATAFDFAGKGSDAVRSAAATTETASLYMARAVPDDLASSATVGADDAAPRTPLRDRTPGGPARQSGVRNILLGGR